MAQVSLRDGRTSAEALPAMHLTVTHHRLRQRAALCTLVLLALGPLSPVPAGATPVGLPALAAPHEASGGSEELPLAPVAPDLDTAFVTHPDLTNVEVTGSGYRAAREAYDAVATELAGAQATRVTAVAAISELEAAQRVALAEIGAATARHDSAKGRADELRNAVNEMAIAAFIEGGQAQAIDLGGDSSDANDRGRREVVAGAVVTSLAGELDAADEVVRTTTLQLEVAEAQRIRIEDDLGTNRKILADSITVENDAAPRLATRRAELEEARAVAPISDADFTLVALDSYYQAAAGMELENPSCGLEWWGLAGISKVEGRHGTYGGVTLDRHGDTSRRIIGIALNGTENTAPVGDTDGGFLDGDPLVDRAVGPMQFIPQTWSRFASDGNDDGVEDPFNLYDATLAAARYLCVASFGLDSDPGLQAAYFSYNHSLLYVDNVLRQARNYQRTIDLRS